MELQIKQWVDPDERPGVDDNPQHSSLFAVRRQQRLLHDNYDPASSSKFTVLA